MSLGGSFLLLVLISACSRGQGRRTITSLGRSCHCFDCFVCKECDTVEGVRTAKCPTKCFKEENFDGTVNRGCLNDTLTTQCNVTLVGEHGTKHCCDTNECNDSTNINGTVFMVTSVMVIAKIIQLLAQW